MSEPGPSPAAGSAEPPLRAARALLGWLPEEQAHRLLSLGRSDVPPTPEQVTLAAEARAAVAARAPSGPQTDVVAELPEGLAEEDARLRADAPKVFEDGWALRMVDLARVYAFQPLAYVDHALQTTAGLGADDLVALARMTVPLVAQTPLRASFDPTKNAWVIVSGNPNLRLMGEFTGPVNSPNGTLRGFGFTVLVSPSRMQVSQYAGRYFLRDGYHRAMGLLSAGINRVPALVRNVTAIEDLGVQPGMLPQDAFMGPRPPTLADYLAPIVAGDVYLPETQKMVLVQAIELGFHKPASQ